MNSTLDVRHGDLWTETVNALGIRASGKHSPFRSLEGRDDALSMVRECSLALLLVGLVQTSLAWLAGVGTAADASVYMPLAFLVYRYQSRVAAALLLCFSLSAVAVVVVGSVWQIEARTDLILIATLLWASTRAVEATGLLHRESTRAGAERSAQGPTNSGRKSNSIAWLTFAAIAFVVAALPKFLPLSSHEDSPATVSAPAVPAPKVDIGGAEAGNGQIVVSAPNGFLEPRSQEPAIAAIAEGFVSPAMELVALFVTPADVEVFRRDHQFAPTRYVMVQTVRKQPARGVSTEEFRAAAAGASAGNITQLERLIGADAALTQWLGAVLRAPGASVELDGTHMRSEGVLGETERSLSVGAVVEVAGSAGPATSRVVVTSVVLARGKVLLLYTYGAFAKPEDVASTHEIARDVVRRLTNENPA